jgi:hypothetical protein
VVAVYMHVSGAQGPSAFIHWQPELVVRVTVAEEADPDSKGGTRGPGPGPASDSESDSDCSGPWTASASLSPASVANPKLQ